VWLVLSQVAGSSGPDAVTSALENLLSPVYANVEQHNFAGLKVLLYSKSKPAN